MKTKSIQKKGKKQLFKISPPSKLDQKSKNINKKIIESKKKHKKAKIDNTVQNGDSMLQVNVKVFEKVNKKKQKKKPKKVKEQNNDNIEMSKAKMKTNVAKKTESTVIESPKKIIDEKKEKKLEHLKNKQLIREMNKAMPKKGRYKQIQDHIKTPVDLDRMKKQLAEIKSRQELSKTAKRRISVLSKKVAVAEAEDKFKKLGTVEKDNNKNQHQVNKSLKNKQKTKVKDRKDRKKAKKEHRRNKKANIEIEQNNQNDNDEDDEDQSDKGENNEDMEKEDEEAMDFGQTEVDAESTEDDSDQRDDEEETAIVEAKKKKRVTYIDVPIKKNKKKKRYVLFVENLPHDITTNQLKQHFLTKVDTVTNIRIQNNQHTKTSSGFAYVEVSNSTDYEKGLALNHTFLKKKRISVQFTAPENAKKVNFVAKNKKLEALRKAKKLANVREKKKLLKKGKQKFTGLQA